METEVKFCTTENVIIAIEKIVIIQIDLNNIECVDFYINNEKIRSYCRIDSHYSFDYPLLCKNKDEGI